MQVYVLPTKNLTHDLIFQMYLQYTSNYCQCIILKQLTFYTDYVVSRYLSHVLLTFMQVRFKHSPIMPTFPSELSSNKVPSRLPVELCLSETLVKDCEF